MPALFISDLHLAEERPAANERFIGFIEERARSADALYILGDFFEYWIGDDDLEAPFNGVMAGLLAGLARGGVPVYVMHGNRDFLIGERFSAATGAQLLADPAADAEPVPTADMATAATAASTSTTSQAARMRARRPRTGFCGMSSPSWNSPVPAGRYAPVPAVAYPAW